MAASEVSVGAFEVDTENRSEEKALVVEVVEDKAVLGMESVLALAVAVVAWLEVAVGLQPGLEPEMLGESEGLTA